MAASFGLAAAVGSELPVATAAFNVKGEDCRRRRRSSLLVRLVLLTRRLLIVRDDLRDGNGSASSSSDDADVNVGVGTSLIVESEPP